MARCADGHESASADYCDVCGMRIEGAPAASGTAASAAPGPASGAASGGGGTGTGASGADVCPNCQTPKSGGVFCEGCGYNFSTAQPLPPAPPASLSAVDPLAPSAPLVPPASSVPNVPANPAAAVPVPDAASAQVPGPPGQVSGWTAVVGADRAYYDTVEADTGPDGSGIAFPAYCPERRFQLAGAEMRIGRRSASRGLDPEIDLTGPPTDPGISRLHAVLIAMPDGAWAVLDPGSSNGTQLNGTELTTGEQSQLHDGDRITLGAWTLITVHSA
jgi:FHA domain